MIGFMFSLEQIVAGQSKHLSCFSWASLTYRCGAAPLRCLVPWWAPGSSGRWKGLLRNRAMSRNDLVLSTPPPSFTMRMGKQPCPVSFHWPAGLWRNCANLSLCHVQVQVQEEGLYQVLQEVARWRGQEAAGEGLRLHEEVLPGHSHPCPHTGELKSCVTPWALVTILTLIEKAVRFQPQYFHSKCHSTGVKPLNPFHMFITGINLNLVFKWTQIFQFWVMRVITPKWCLDLLLKIPPT